MNSVQANPQPQDVVIVAAKRTPQGKFLGAISSLSAVQLGAQAARAAIEASGLEAADIDQVIFGQVVQAGCGQNPARQSAVAAGVPLDVPSITLNSVCLSGLRAVIEAAKLIRLGEATVVLAGGQESMSQAPHVVPASRRGTAYGSVSMVDSVANDALTDAATGQSMGLLTENGEVQRAITREEQDLTAYESHIRAARAQSNGVFSAELAPVTVPQRRGEDLIVDSDEGIRPSTTTEKLAGLRPAFTEEGTITAGNSSPLSDGAAAVILTTREYAEAKNLRVLATVAGWANVAGPDTSLHLQPANAIKTALDLSGWCIDDVDFFEINEAFAAVSIASIRELGINADKVNIHGGAIALGHPVGASGARLVTHAAHYLNELGSGRAAIALCGGGGQGDALLLEL